MARLRLVRALLAVSTGVGLASCTLLTGVGDLVVDGSDAAIDGNVVHPITTTDTGVGESGPVADVDARDGRPA